MRFWSETMVLNKLIGQIGYIYRLQFLNFKLISIFKDNVYVLYKSYTCLCCQGMNVSLLKLPLNLATEGQTGYDVTNVTLGALASDEPFAGKRYMSLIMRKPVLAICEQQRRKSACASSQSVQHLCFRCLDSIIHLLAISKSSRL